MSNHSATDVFRRDAGRSHQLGGGSRIRRERSVDCFLVVARQTGQEYLMCNFVYHADSRQDEIQKSSDN
jgi:hypothetical protein